MSENDTIPKKSTSQINKAVFFTSALLIFLLVAFAAVFPDVADKNFKLLQQQIFTNASWFYILTVALVLISVVFLAVSRYGDIKLEKSIPRGGWMELPLDKVNYLRELVGLQPESRSKVLLDDKRSQFKQSAQIRRAVRKHRELQHTENRQAHPERNYGGAVQLDGPAAAKPATKRPTRSQAQRTRQGSGSDVARTPERRPSPRKPRG